MDELEPRAGAVVAGRYRLDARIGVGAWSQVFRATDLKDGRSVALKVLSTETVDATGAERFRREAELASKLRHPNTIRLVAYNVRTRPWPFIVYELLEGESLQDLMRREGPLPETRAAAITMQVLRSLMEAHEVGIVHRDVKPGNVFVCGPETRLGGVKVLDFGIAKSVDGLEAHVTAAGILVGTPRYMPPEQIRGETPIPAMDLYATGMMLAEMLSGQPTLTCSAAEACLEQLRPERIPLPEVLQRSRLWPIIWRATDKDLATRYSTANEMLGDLERIFDELSPAPLLGRAPGESHRSSLVPTTVMASPERAPPPSTLPPADPRPPRDVAERGRTVAWLVGMVALFVAAIALTAAGVYWVRTRGGL